MSNPATPAVPASGSQLELPHQGEQGADLPRVADDAVWVGCQPDSSDR